MQQNSYADGVLVKILFWQNVSAVSTALCWFYRNLKQGSENIASRLREPNWNTAKKNVSIFRVIRTLSKIYLVFWNKFQDLTWKQRVSKGQLKIQHNFFPNHPSTNSRTDLGPFVYIRVLCDKDCVPWFIFFGMTHNTTHKVQFSQKFEPCDENI